MRSSCKASGCPSFPSYWQKQPVRPIGLACWTQDQPTRELPKQSSTCPALESDPGAARCGLASIAQQAASLELRLLVSGVPLRAARNAGKSVFRQSWFWLVHQRNWLASWSEKAVSSLCWQVQEAKKKGSEPASQINCSVPCTCASQPFSESGAAARSPDMDIAVIQGAIARASTAAESKA